MCFIIDLLHRSSCKPSHSTSSTSNSFASLAVLSNTELPSGYQSAISLSPLEANTKLQDAHTGSKNAVYHVVGSLSSSQVQHNYEQSPQPSHTDALAVWSISFTQSSPSSKPQQSQQQGRGPQSSHSARLQLVGHHQVASSPNGTCQAVHVMSSTQTCAQLVTKDSREGLRVQNLSWADGKLELSSVSDLPCLAGALPGEQFDAAPTKTYAVQAEAATGDSSGIGLDIAAFFVDIKVNTSTLYLKLFQYG